MVSLLTHICVKLNIDAIQIQIKCFWLCINDTGRENEQNKETYYSRNSNMLYKIMVMIQNAIDVHTEHVYIYFTIS